MALAPLIATARSPLCSSPARRPHGSNSHDVDAAEARAFIEARGFEPTVARAVVENLLGPDWGTPAGGVMRMAKQLAGRWEVGEDAGLVALAKAVEREMAETTGKAPVSIVVHPPRGEIPFVCEGYEGATLRDVREHGTGAGAKLLAEYLECACSGVAACSTCHVYVDDEWWEAVGPPPEEEEDMLDLAHERREHSRLGCQIVLEPRLEGLVLRLPSGANNLFDDIPFE